jgi:hypothetical protein
MFKAAVVILMTLIFCAKLTSIYFVWKADQERQEAVQAAGVARS